MLEFARENERSELTGELIGDTLDDALASEGDAEAEDKIVSQVRCVGFNGARTTPCRRQWSKYGIPLIPNTEDILDSALSEFGPIDSAFIFTTGNQQCRSLIPSCGIIADIPRTVHPQICTFKSTFTSKRAMPISKSGPDIGMYQGLL